MPKPGQELQTPRLNVKRSAGAVSSRERAPVSSISQALISRVEDAKLSRAQKSSIIFLMAFIDERGGGDTRLLGDLMVVMTLMELKAKPQNVDLLRPGEALSEYSRGRERLKEEKGYTLTVSALFEDIRMTYLNDISGQPQAAEKPHLVS